jgi:hypothetical protein
MTHDVSVRGTGGAIFGGILLIIGGRAVVTAGPCRHRPRKLLYQKREHLDHDERRYLGAGSI